MFVRTMFLSLLAFSLGCSQTDTATSDAATTDMESAAVEGMEVPESEVAVDGDAVALTPENTKIGFVGSHIVEQKPDPEARVGSFESFTGTATVADGQLVALQVDIDTESITTSQDKLTAHLKNADFFDVLEYPRASFKSTSITAGENGQVTVAGDLTMLKETKSISFPATVSTEGGLKMSANFMIDRSEFGMNFGLEKIEKEVEMTISIGG